VCGSLGAHTRKDHPYPRHGSTHGGRTTVSGQESDVSDISIMVRMDRNRDRTVCIRLGTIRNIPCNTRPYARKIQREGESRLTSRNPIAAFDEEG
jgi:hypothetical protein